MKKWTINLFGQIAARRNNRVISELNDSPTLQKLLAYLILHKEQPQLRVNVAQAFYAELPVASARRNLNTIFFRLQSALGKDFPCLVSTKSTLQFVTNPHVKVDCHEFLRLNRQQLNEQKIATLEKLLFLYKAPLLENINETWCIAHRAEYHKMAHWVVNSLDTHYKKIKNAEARSTLQKHWQILDQSTQLDKLRARPFSDTSITSDEMIDQVVSLLKTVAKNMRLTNKPDDALIYTNMLLSVPKLAHSSEVLQTLRHKDEILDLIGQRDQQLENLLVLENAANTYGSENDIFDVATRKIWLGMQRCDLRAASSPDIALVRRISVMHNEASLVFFRVLGAAQFEAGLFPQARISYDKAFNISRELRLDTTIDQINIAATDIALLAYKGAINSLADLAQKLDNKLLIKPRVLGNLSIPLLRTGQITEAERIVSQSLMIASQNHDTSVTRWLLSRKCDILINKSKYDEAHELACQQMKLAFVEKDWSSYIEFGSLLANHFVGRKNWREADRVAEDIFILANQHFRLRHVLRCACIGLKAATQIQSKSRMQIWHGRLIENIRSYPPPSEEQRCIEDVLSMVKNPQKSKTSGICHWGP